MWSLAHIMWANVCFFFLIDFPQVCVGWRLIAVLSLCLWFSFSYMGLGCAEKCSLFSVGGRLSVAQEWWDWREV